LIFYKEEEKKYCVHYSVYVFVKVGGQ